MASASELQSMTADEQRDFFLGAAQRVAKAQLDRLSDAWQTHTGTPVPDAMRNAFRNIVWQCSGQTVDTLVTAFSKPA